jgi:arginyl-tRNA synthetase
MNIFKNVVRLYNEHREAFYAYHKWYKENRKGEEDCDKHLQELYEMWEKTTMKTPCSRFFDMKEHHSHINGTEIQNELWERYIELGLEFRTTMMAASHFK